MQSTQQRFSGSFNNPFHQGPHYQMEESVSSEPDMQPPTLGGRRGSNVHNPFQNQGEEVVLDFRPQHTENPLNAQNSVTEREPETNNNVILEPETVPPTHQDNVTDRSAITQLIRSWMFDILKWNVFNLMGFSLAIAVLQWDLPYLYVLVFLWLSDTYNIITLSNNGHHSQNPGGNNNTFGIVTTMLFAIFKVFLVIQIETKALMITIPLAPLLAAELIATPIKCFKNRKSPTAIFYKIEAIFKLLLITQAALIGLKVDDLLTWEWREVFCPFWILFSTLIGISFSFFLMFTGKCCTYMFAEMEFRDVRSIFWFFYVIGGKTVLGCTLVIQSLSILQGNDGYSSLLGVFVAIPAYSLTLIVYTGVFFREIEALAKKLTAAEATNEEEEQEQGDKEKTSPKEETENIDIPKFLTKFSSTYFRRATPDEVQKVKDKKSAKDTKKNAGANKSKLPKRRQNSLDFQKLRSVNNVNVTGHSTNLNLLTVPETEVERTKTTDWNNTSRFGLRTDKGKDFFSSLTDRTGVSGIMPSGLMINKTDRSQNLMTEGTEAKDLSPLNSNDSYLLPPISKETEAPLRPRTRKKEDKILSDLTPELTTAGTPDISPLGPRGNDALGDLPDQTIVKHRRVQSMQEISPSQIISLSEALESPKVKVSARADQVEGLKSPSSEGSTAATCLICFENIPDAVFMECGHGGVCYECSLEIWKSTGECYLCRNKITQVLQVDLKAKLGNHVIKVLSSTQMILYEEEDEVVE